MNNIRKKGALLAVSVLLLIAAGVYLTLGWYTKMTSVGGMEFDVARWDFSANYSISDYMLNVYSYSQIDGGSGKKAAPGTAGEIPVKLSAEASETDVDYTIVIDKTTMSPEFQERIFFYTDPDMAAATMITPDKPIEGTIPAKDVKTVTIYWKWIYEYKDIPAGYSPIVEQGENAAQKFDEFDTAVGKRPDLYEPKMNATMKISGLQSVPELS